jgi:hypothetical protein
MSGFRVGAGVLGQGAGHRGDLAGVDVQQSARDASGARGELEEAAETEASTARRPTFTRPRS